MKKLELLVPPGILIFIFAFFMWLTALITPSFNWSITTRGAGSILVLITAVVLFFSAGWSFRRAQTTVNPIHPENTTTLVSSGIYKLSRNPIYVAFLLTLLSVAVGLANIYAVSWCIIFVLYLNFFQIKPEEKALTKLFGDQFLRYQTTVRRWL